MAIASVALVQFTFSAFIHNGVNILGDWHVIIVLSLAASASIVESVRTGAHCDITTIQHDLMIVLNHLNQK